MSKWQDDVQDFHEKMKITIGDTIALRDVELRRNLIREEAKELDEALERGDLVEVIDGCIDLMYVTLGTLVSMGVPADPFWDEVQASNMKKAGAGKRDDGKQLKPIDWAPPRIAAILRKMLIAEAQIDEGARLIRWNQAIDFLREQLGTNPGELRAIIESQPKTWWEDSKKGWGQQVVYLLRSEGYDEVALGVEDLIDSYPEMVEAALRPSEICESPDEEIISATIYTTPEYDAGTLVKQDPASEGQEVNANP